MANLVTKVDGEVVFFDAQTNATRLEMPQDQIQKTLHVVIDEGSVGYYAILFLLLHCQLRMTFSMDPCHRVANNVE